ncbi:[NiFe]-hydrogenase assembly chaperone HybE [Alkalilimnicola ehrlichii]|uniref:[NiFe]-hydrogenase assembly chaperone HybE n=1 Tax=Alkalilimnicola ehrlichii TaxID=351052 RepID=UPI003BA062B8
MKDPAMSGDTWLTQQVQLLEAAFHRVQDEQMAEMALANPALTVEAVGFHRYQGRPFGALLSPWFLNLILLPGEGEDWERLPERSEQHWALPAGIYLFHVCRAAGIGTFQACSMMSPVERVEDQDTFRMMAEAVLRSVCRPSGHSRRAVLTGRFDDEGH